MARFDPKAVDEWVKLSLAKFDPYYKGDAPRPEAPPAATTQLDPHKTAHDLGYDDPVFKAQPGKKK